MQFLLSFEALQQKLYTPADKIVSQKESCQGFHQLFHPIIQ